MKKKKKRKLRKEYGKEKLRGPHLFPLIRFHIWNQCSALEEFFARLQQKGNYRSLLILLLDQQFVLFFLYNFFLDQNKNSEILKLQTN